MKHILLNDVIRAVNGVLLYDKDIDGIFIRNVSTDTRTINLGELFIPIAGEKFDGHDYIRTAFECGAICCLSEKVIETDGIVIKVSDTKKALRDLAEYYRSLFHIPVVAITGSAGKTTTKDIIASVLSKRFNVLCTKGNFNNEIGVPLTIFQIEDSHDVAVIEMGMNHFNEIHNLSKIARPDVAVITNIGFSHIGMLGNREGIMRAKCEIFDYMNDEGIKILNGDDDMLCSLKGKYDRTCFYGLNTPEYDVYADEISYNGVYGISCQIHTSKNYIHADMKIPGRHMISNVLAAAAVGSALNLSSEEIKNGIDSFVPSKMRMDIINTDKYTIINDAYNSNPASVKAAIDVLTLARGRKACILGDMFELGHESVPLHRDVGEYAGDRGIDVIVAIGELSVNLFQGALNRINKYQTAYYFKTQNDFFEHLEDILESGDTILVKASRGMKFEKTVEKIKE